MLRLFAAFLSIAVLAGAAVWFADRPGEIIVVWQGLRIETSLGIAALAVLVVAVVAALLYRLWLGVRRVGGHAARRRRRLGQDALAAGLIALAAGEPAAARRQAKRAEKLLDSPPLTLLLTAQAAQLAGDEAAAQDRFRAMLERPETELVGIRGLLAQAHRTGDRAGALELARRAAALRPNATWVIEATFELLAEAGRWREAQTALERAAKAKLFPAERVARHRAALRYAEARSAETSGRAREALGHAKGARELKPDFAAAAVLEARLHRAAGRTPRAERAIAETWAKAPHADLAAAWTELHAADTPAERLARLDLLQARNPDHPETRILLAGAAFAAEDWPVARANLEAALAATDRPDARLCRLMADFEEVYKGDAQAARGWLVRAAQAPVAGRWRCAACGEISPAWEPLCPACGAFDQLTHADQAAAPPRRLAQPATEPGPV